MKDEAKDNALSNIVFYFSGTGNSLKVAKTICEELRDGEIVSMAKSAGYTLAKQYDSVGFIYPVYFWGLPKIVIEFIGNLDLTKSKNAYYYSIATYGGSAGNAVNQLYKLLLNRHGIKLNYGRKLRMFSNYVVMYNMSKKINEITKKSGEKLMPIIDAVKKKENNSINRLTKVYGFLNKQFIKNVSTMDRNFTVNNNCNGCGICKTVCPVGNIEIQNSKPVYNHKCEQCVACIQFCPQRAINYKNVTQTRRRYTNPEISYKELAERNKM
jgi:ferredoxin/flavodoxin